MEQIANTQKQDLPDIFSDALPELASLDVLQKYADISLLKGLRTMDNIIQGTSEDKDKIGATKAVLGIAKFVFDRSKEMGMGDTSIVDDLDVHGQPVEVSDGE